MRTTERLRKLKEWAQGALCQGRMMKAPAPDLDITQIIYQEPQCYLGWQPARPDLTGFEPLEPINVCPGILIMPGASRAKYVEEKRFDRFNNVRRAQEMGRSLDVSMLFSVYEPGIRLPGFAESAQSPQGLDIGLLQEGTEQGLFTLYDWMDDCMEKLLAQKFIPGTDLFVDEASMVYSLYTDQNFAVDKRPIFYGFINVDFYGYADEGVNPGIDQYLN